MSGESMYVRYDSPTLGFKERMVDDEPSCIELYVPSELYLRDREIYDELQQRAVRRDVDFRLYIDD